MYFLVNINFFNGSNEIHSILESGSSERKKAKTVNINIFAKISHNESRDALLNKKCLRHSKNRIQTKNHKMKTNNKSNQYQFFVVL